MTKRATRLCGMTLFYSIFIMACGPSNQQGESQVSGYVSKYSTRWPSNNIEVCWASEGEEDLKLAIQEYSVSEYAKADIVLSGWKDCSKEGSMESVLPIAFEQFSYLPSGFSKQIGYVAGKNGVHLGIASNQSGDACHRTEEGQSNCVASVAVHEIGHALGLYHEMARLDNPECTLNYDSSREWNEGIQIGDFDKNSIMNYCFAFQMETHGSTRGLSEGDIAALKGLFHGIVAEVDARPRTFADLEKGMKVAGTNVKIYKFQVGAEDKIDCLDETAYSESFDVAEPLTAEVLGLKESDANTLVKLCLLGGKATGEWQPVGSYSSLLMFDYPVEPSKMSYELPRVSLKATDKLGLTIKADFETLPTRVFLFVEQQSGSNLRYAVSPSISKAERGLYLELSATSINGLGGDAYEGKLTVVAIGIIDMTGKMFLDELDPTTKIYKKSGQPVLEFAVSP